MIRTLSLAFTAIALAAMAPSTAQACMVAPGNVDYVINSLDYRVDNIIRFNEGSCSGGRGGTLTALPTQGTPYSLTNVFYPDGHDLLFLLGTATDLAGDPPGQKHLVIFGKSSWVQGAQGIAFGTLFPTTLEASLIAALEDAATGFGQQSSYDVIDNFWNGEADSAGLKFAPDENFSIIAFSNGQTIGEGITSFTPSAIPEPASWALMLSGFGLVGAISRRKAVCAVPARTTA